MSRILHLLKMEQFFLDPEFAEIGRFLDPETGEILHFLDQIIVKIDISISGSMNSRNGKIS